ncbi:UvrD-like DNA helicase, C terminal protein [Desulforamulus reducens MI-1]|uniref:ATP-dependent helicase/deoxyribonuclease subunit B n=1 Tax=Desulforamulus reducens (strain ATCC BAA-1160 / DSM 100696 / MI-1) TaxID=349161 RepID=ADDB_DESRM|nr:helicase-exonuclease AddAB subunit AddB [Desulforamulus reducens]A4J4E2.1 RecName: Full=ATP-dependent helicase/deoxyribonuclease subunit B; AltName: Full=ATP-dependent helicase/nuclease AddB; AltName: Full=DNA 3'-5' helicase AddB [Desulforamulus reducens MI-1]ABO49945.1 UvrD-like DNA helicase, C terminal protein [Desulforamulus reducens MI-1]
MSLRFIVGRAGSGKSHSCLEEVRQRLRQNQGESSIILLVPEQATFQYEYMLATTPELKGMIWAQVLSFRRLAFRVLQEMGGAARAHIDDLGKKMVLRRILEQRKSELKVFHRAAKQPGFADSLASALSELKLYRIEPQELQKGIQHMQEAPGSAIRDKLADLSLLYNDLEEFLSGRFTDPDDYLNLLAQRLPGSRTVQGAEIFIDGFTGFTPQEYGVIEQMLGTADRVHVALCFDPMYLQEPCDELEFFYPTVETYHTLLDMAGALRISLEPPIICGKETPVRFQKDSAIAHLEKYYFRHPLQASDAAQGVSLVACANRRAEVEAAAREIIRLCREEELSWRDIVVVLRDLTNYSDLINTIFNDHGIPVFIDEKRNVLHHPLVELIRSALEVITQHWAYDPVFRYLKTDLIPVQRDDVDRLENYVLAHGIRGNRWNDNRDWTYRRQYTLGEDCDIDDNEAEQLAQLNVVRYAAIEHINNFSKKVANCGNVRQITTALFELLESLSVAERMEAWAKEAEVAGRLIEAKEHAQIWDNVILLLDEIVEAMGEQELNLEEYLQVLEAGLESLKLGLIPPGLDQVVVGTLERSRNPNVKAALVLGISDGVLPARPVEEGLFSDYEREALREIGLNLAPGARRKLFDEQYLIYTALTRASSRLWLSYPQADDEGKALMPSPVIQRVKELLPLIQEEILPVEPPCLGGDLAFIANPSRSLSYLAAMLRETVAGRLVDPVWQDVYSWFVQQPQYQESCRRVLAGLYHVNQETSLPPSMGRRLYGSRLRASVSRLERFTTCPFSHFLSHGLKLKERSQFKLAAPDLGQFFHAALKLFAERIKALSLDWGQLSRGQIITITGEIVEELAPQLQNEILLSTARHRYLIKKLRRTLERAVVTLAEHARRGSFRPVAVEIGFGDNAELPAVQLDLADHCQMEMAGRIDRIDSACEGGQHYYSLIDYKSGQPDIKLADIVHGLKLQLLTYLDVALRYSKQLTQQEALPAAMLYFSVRDPFVASTGPMTEEEAEKNLLKQLKMKGLLLADPLVISKMDKELSGQSDLLPVGLKKNGDFYSNSRVITEEQFKLLRNYLEFKLKSIGQQMVSGDIAISPYQRGKEKACRYCIFKSVCQFDPLLEDNLFRLLADQEEQVLWSLIKESLGDKHE